MLLQQRCVLNVVCCLVVWLVVCLVVWLFGCLVVCLFVSLFVCLFLLLLPSLTRVARRSREVTQNSTVRQLTPTKGQATMALQPCTPFLITNAGRRPKEHGALRVLPLAQQREGPLVLLCTRSSTAGSLQKQPWRTVFLDPRSTFPAPLDLPCRQE